MLKISINSIVQKMTFFCVFFHPAAAAHGVDVYLNEMMIVELTVFNEMMIIEILKDMIHLKQTIFER